MFESSLCQILFYLLAAIAVLCAVGVVAFRNPVNSAMCMALSFAMVAAIFFGMGAQFLGIVQLIVYAGAILVLFLFVVMMLDIHDEDKSRGSYIHAAIGVLIAGFFAGLTINISLGLPGATSGTCPVVTMCDSFGELLIGDARATSETAVAAAPYGGSLPELSAAAAARMENPSISEADAAAATSIPDVKLLGKCLFTHYNIPFVILSFALLSGTVGAVALARKIRKD
ncbi:MAG: NADH-quinone oxidoreductase subunit J [Akkermansia sp.]|nr:NADH-quinone oxidoreductase subunit J [Akkermansia sp.]